MTSMGVSSLLERATSRQDYQMLKEQLNIEAVTAVAVEEILNEKSVSDQLVDTDWISRFFDAAEHVSSKEMQVLWGKMLAGEVKQPGTYSLRTLKLLQNCTKKDTDIFIKAAQTQGINLTEAEMRLLQELGLIRDAKMYELTSVGQELLRLVS